MRAVASLSIQSIVKCYPFMSLTVVALLLLIFPVSINGRTPFLRTTWPSNSSIFGLSILETSFACLPVSFNTDTLFFSESLPPWPNSNMGREHIVYTHSHLLILVKVPLQLDVIQT